MAESAQQGPRLTPKPKSLSPARGGRAVTGVERHTQMIAKRSKISPAAIVIVAFFAIGAVAIIAVSVAKKEQPKPRQAPPPVSQMPQVRPALPTQPTASPAALQPPARTAAEQAPKPRPARKVRFGDVTGIITDEGRDQRTVALLCPACGQAVPKGASTCPACGQPLDWTDLPCPYCFGKPGSGICAMCRGSEPRRMMAVEIRCPVCDGTKKCMRCDGTGKFKAE